MKVHGSVRQLERGVKIFKTYMNMMSEKVLILLCDVHSSFLIYFPFYCTHTHMYTKHSFLRAAAAAAIKLFLTKFYRRTQTHRGEATHTALTYDVLERISFFYYYFRFGGKSSPSLKNGAAHTCENTHTHTHVCGERERAKYFPYEN
jgi:hypothetical protein